MIEEHEARAVEVVEGFVTRMRDMGATHVTIGDIAIVFAAPVAQFVRPQPAQVTHINTPLDKRAELLEAISDV